MKHFDKHPHGVDFDKCRVGSRRALRLPPHASLQPPRMSASELEVLMASWLRSSRLTGYCERPELARFRGDVLLPSQLGGGFPGVPSGRDPNFSRDNAEWLVSEVTNSRRSFLQTREYPPAPPVSSPLTEQASWLEGYLSWLRTGTGLAPEAPLGFDG